MSTPNRHSADQPASRRDFLKTSAALAAAGSLSLSRSAHAAGSDEIKIALIGCGGRGTGAAANALATTANVKLVALHDAFPERVTAAYNALNRQFAARVDVPDARRFSGLDGYLQALNANVDLVLLCTPPGFRPQQFEAAVKAGKHVFMEKPVAVDGPGVRQVLAANEEAKKKGLAVAVGHHLRHEDKHREVVKRIHDGAIGPVKFLRAYFNTGSLWVRPRKPDQTEMQFQVSNWYYYNWLSGDHIVEQHVHDLDACNWIMQGHPVEAQGLGGRQVRKGPNFGEIFDHHAVEFTYPDGTKMFSYCRQIDNCWGSFSQHAHGTKGVVNIDGHGTSELRVDGQEPLRWKREKDGHQVEMDDLFAALLAGQPYNEGEHGAHSTMTAILGRMATASGQIVRWDDAIKSELNLLPPKLTWDAQPLVLPDQNGEYACAMPGKTKAW